MKASFRRRWHIIQRISRNALCCILRPSKAAFFVLGIRRELPTLFHLP